jgi:hypothetical protein
MNATVMEKPTKPLLQTFDMLTSSPQAMSF